VPRSASGTTHTRAPAHRPTSRLWWPGRYPFARPHQTAGARAPDPLL